MEPDRLRSVNSSQSPLQSLSGEGTLREKYIVTTLPKVRFYIAVVLGTLVLANVGADKSPQEKVLFEEKFNGWQG